MTRQSDDAAYEKVIDAALVKPKCDNVEAECETCSKVGECALYKSTLAMPSVAAVARAIARSLAQVHL